jgi:hypothetical protein
MSSAVEEGRRRLDLDDADDQQDDDQEPRHAEDPEQEWDHLDLLPATRLPSGGSHAGALEGPDA